MTHTTAAEHHHTTPVWEGIKTVKFAIWLFLASEIMFFAGLIVAYISIRYSDPNWLLASELLSVPLVALNTFILIFSSVTMVLAFDSAEQGDLQKSRYLLLATAILGIVFLSIQGFEWSDLMHEGIQASTNLFGSTFYTLTGFHGAHVAIGVIWVLSVTAKAFRGGYAEDHLGIELAGLYWHFVDLVWIILFTIIYLI
ncbi:MAG TPA: heme-copper oxidase subunit III [Anaerolineales bacterium]|nr:heme-copper oxidase subunit III [Anaerolineales bacterium]